MDPTSPRRTRAATARRGPAAVTLDSAGWSLATAGERDELIRRALATDAGHQLARCFGTHGVPVGSLRAHALLRTGRQPTRRPQRHGHLDRTPTRTPAPSCAATASPPSAPPRLELRAVHALDRRPGTRRPDAGLDWSRDHHAREHARRAAARAHAQLPIDLDDPAVWVAAADRQRALARRLGLDAAAGEQLSAGRSRTSTPSTRTTCAAGGSPHRPGSSWPTSSCRPCTASSGRSASCSPPRRGDGWELTPTFSLDAIRVLAALGATLERDLRAAVLPADAATRPARALEPAHAARRPARERRRRQGTRRRAHARTRAAREPRRAAATRSTAGAACSSAATPTPRPTPTSTRRSRCASSRCPAAGSRAAGSARRRSTSYHATHSAADGARRGRPDRDRTRPAAAAVLRGLRRAQGHRPRRTHEGPPRPAGDHHRRRPQRQHPHASSPSRRSPSCANSSAPARR